MAKRLSPICAFCRLDRNESPSWVCGECAPKLTPIISPYCHRCGDPFREATSVVHDCHACQKEPPAFDEARSLYRYDGFFREKLLAYKYSGALYLESAFQEIMRDGAAAIWADRLSQLDAIVPLPPDPIRGRNRGYNPPLRLSVVLAQAYRLPLIWRGIGRHPRSSQTGLSISERRYNVKDAFYCDESRQVSDLTGKKLLLVDDVWTTGNTMNAFSRFAKQTLGAQSVWALTLARRF